MPFWALTPARKWCLTMVISVTVSAMSRSSSFAFRAGHHHVEAGRLPGEERAHLVERQVAVAKDDVELVEEHEVVARGLAPARLDHRLRRLPGGLGGADVARPVLGLPGEAFPHGADVDLVREAFEDGALPGLPLALDVLDDPHPLAVADRPGDEAERRGRLPLALPGVDDEETLLDGLGSQGSGPGPPCACAPSRWRGG